MFQGKILVQGVNRAEKEPLNLFDPKSVQIQWEVNQTWSLQLTAYNDGSLAYQMLESEASVFLDNQEYIIKQVADDSSSGLDSIQVTATHVYFEVQKIRKYKEYVDPEDKDKQTDVKVLKDDTDSAKSDDGDNAKTDTSEKTEGNTTTKVTTKTTDETQQDNQNQVSYSIQDVLNHWLKDNKLGFTYEVIGSFEKKELEELQDGTGADMLAKISDTWDNAIIYPDNRKIRVYSTDKFNLNRGNRIDYLNNASEIKFSTDSTSLTNMAYCIGGKYSVETTTETTTETSSNSNTQEYYYFAPFMYRDEESIKKYGEHPAEPIEDGRFKDKNAMIEYVKTKLQPEPSLSIDVTTTTDIKPIAGDVVHVMVKSQNISTNFTLTGFTWYPYSYPVDNPTSITLNSNVQNILDYQNSRQRQFRKAISELKSSTNEAINNSNIFNEFGGNQQLKTWLNDFVGG